MINFFGQKDSARMCDKTILPLSVICRFIYRVEYLDREKQTGGNQLKEE